MLHCALGFCNDRLVHISYLMLLSIDEIVGLPNILDLNADESLDTRDQSLITVEHIYHHK